MRIYNYHFHENCPDPPLELTRHCCAVCHHDIPAERATHVDDNTFLCAVCVEDYRCKCGDVDFSNEFEARGECEACRAFTAAYAAEVAS